MAEWLCATLIRCFKLVRFQSSPPSKLRTALAQSGEHYTVTVEATGSKPVRSAKHAPVAQLVEHMIEDHGRVGSTPTGCTKYASVAEMD